MLNRYSFVITIVIVVCFGFPYTSYSQNTEVTGTVYDAEIDDSLPGVNIIIKGTNQGTSSDVNGNFSLNVPSLQDTLVFSYIGYQIREIPINGRTTIDVYMTMQSITGEEIVVVGYGTQERSSVVGSISTTSSVELQRTGSVSDLSESLTGAIPGVTTLQTTGRPGEESVQFLIRGQSTWSGGQPLVLVDGVQRSITDIDKSEVESVSVLKDASATAVYGVEGANGVILITTKRGSQRTAPRISVNATLSGKQVSRLPTLVRAQEAIGLRNDAIEYEVAANPNSWDDYVPQAVRERYGVEQYSGVYPDVDWRDVMIRGVGLSQRFGLDIQGGTDFVSYFGSLSYLHEGDILNTEADLPTRSYDPSYAYDRLNYRSNLDFDLTETTDFRVSLGGFLGYQKGPHVVDREMNFKIYQALIAYDPTAIVARHDDGVYGMPPTPTGNNRYYEMTANGVARDREANVTTDFQLKQDLSSVVQGLGITAKVSYDITTGTTGPYDDDQYNWQQRYINPAIINAQTAQDSAQYINYLYERTSSGFEYEENPVNYEPEQFGGNFSGDFSGSLSTQLYYEAGLEFNRSIADHTITGLALFNRQENKFGSNWKSYKENWVGRVTYNYDQRYFLEINGAYSGSEKFGPGYKFDFFPSAAVGYDISNESFFNIDFISQFKLRYSHGIVGTDQGIDRWLYSSSYTEVGSQTFGADFNQSPYTRYAIEKIANPNAHWATARKQNIGLDATLDVGQQGIITLSADLFWEDRYDIFVSGNDRAVPDLFGALENPSANLGETNTKGYEIALNINQPLNQNFAVWTSMNFTYAKDKILNRDDPELLPFYQRQAGYQIGQNRGNYPYGYMDNWDEVYASTPGNSNDFRLPGDKQVIDYNADGILDNDDSVPWGYPSRPDYTWSTTLGVNYKGWSISTQFYGVFNINRGTGLTPFGGTGSPSNIVFAYMRPSSGESWWPQNQQQNQNLDPFDSGRIGWKLASSQTGFSDRDASYVRLKNAQISYSVSNELLADVTDNLISQFRIYVSGYNLWMWAPDMPLDAETEASENYPLFKRANFGIEVSF